MKKYESLYVIVPELNEEETKSVIDKFNGIITANGGEIVKVDEWGKRRLAYPIDYKNEGYYVLVVFESEGNLPAELERNMKNDEKIMRYKVTVHHE
ncbi:MAG: 30S ribosomal protein S6 [Clostridia bacterium]|nr:30S ribosomal protein S6 [Clostridia bacterium]MBR3298384.1 30S ribosomal protein S6 [Clostridia bacterium]